MKLRGRLLIPLTLMAVGTLVLNSGAQQPEAASQSQRLAWWRDARFGMFIHWGLYAIPAGEWNGQQVAGIGEWIMNRAKIPVRDYEQLATRFNPVKFDPDAWVRVAKSAGQRYMVITAKHHDGFAMFRSRVSKYNVYDATPFHRDVVGELAAACKRAEMPLGFYYSQTQDWHERDGDGNTWDFDPSNANFDKYLREKAIPQVRELLTNYGPVALIWFDTPKNITPAESKELVDLVHTLQPKCLVDGRIGNNMGDYQSTGDNEIPSKRLSYDWEVPATLNDTWGFKRNDTNWKSSQTLIRQLVDIVSKNGNYLLNVGPTAEGIIPQPSIDRLQQVGSWLKTNGSAVYGAKPSPYPFEFDWGSVTAKPDRAFLNIVEWPKDGNFVLYGFNSKVEKALLLVQPSATVAVEQREFEGHAELHLSLPSKAPDSNVSVVELQVKGMPLANQRLTQQPDGSVSLNGQFAELGPGSSIKIGNRGVTTNWTKPTETVSWNFDLYRRGKYVVFARTGAARVAGVWTDPAVAPPQELRIQMDGELITGILRNEAKIPDPRNPLFPDTQSKLGEFTLDAGQKRLTVSASALSPDTPSGIHLREIVLTPAK